MAQSIKRTPRAVAKAYWRGPLWNWPAWGVRHGMLTKLTVVTSVATEGKPYLPPPPLKNVLTSRYFWPSFCLVLRPYSNNEEMQIIQKGKYSRNQMGTDHVTSRHALEYITTMVVGNTGGIEEGFIQKTGQRSSLLIGGQNLFHSLPRLLCILHQDDLKNRVN